MDHKMHGIVFDHGRNARIGMPEAVFCEGKSAGALKALLSDHGKNGPSPVLFTRLRPEVFNNLPEQTREQVVYHELSRTAWGRVMPPVERGRVAVVSAGTSDGGVTWEAARTLEFLGINHTVYEDNGVAGLWRLTGNLKELNSYDVLIVVAGLDAALASVMGGLTPRPIIGVPTSVGYGMAKGGETALASMLVSCAQGVSVMNIDNGFGAACAASRIIRLLNSPSNP